MELKQEFTLRKSLCYDRNLIVYFLNYSLLLRSVSHYALYFRS